MSIIGRIIVCLGIAGALCCAGCGYRYYAEPLGPAADAASIADMQVADDGTVTFTQGRLEISIRPMTDEELNRQFAVHSQSGIASTNPFTYGDWSDPEAGASLPRFTVFRLKVKNYKYPKLQVSPQAARIIAQNGREYTPLGLPQLEWYYQKYLTSYSGNNYLSYKERVGILRRTMYAGDMVFSGQEDEGFLLFPVLHHDVSRIRLQLRDVSLRFDVWNEPIEQADIEYLFERKIGRVYATGETTAGT
jgi:hypothetical protein